MTLESSFTMDTSSIKYGPGVTREVGHDMKSLGAHRVLVVTDPSVVKEEPTTVVMESLRKSSLDAVLFDRTRIEPTDLSFKEAIEFAQEGMFDGYVSVGGGSSIDTAKVANLYSSHPADFLTYVNSPIGGGRPVPGKLKPHIAIPTTAGTGSETTGVAIFDFLEMHTKTGIASRALRPVMGIIDPHNTRSLPRMVAACSGLDVLCHALESITALPYNARPAPERIELRPSYQGANPISHVWASKAIELAVQNIVRAVVDPSDEEARGNMLLASSYAGIGFGNAGVHLPHGMSYPVSGMVKDYQPEGYSANHPIIPHGMAVVLNAPAVFRFTATTDPKMHLYCASLMGVDISAARPEDAGELLANALLLIMRATGIPNGLSAVGYSADDIDRLVAGTMPQHRVTKLSPRHAGTEQLRELFLGALSYW